MAKDIEASVFEVTDSIPDATPVPDAMQGTMQSTASGCNEVQRYSMEQVMSICSIARRTAFKYAAEILGVWYWLPEYKFRVNGVYSEFALGELKRRKALGNLENYQSVVHSENTDMIALWKASQQPAPETPTESELKATSALMKIAADGSPFSGLAIQSKPTEKVETLTIELQKTEAQVEADFAAFMELTAEIINQDEAAELADDLEFERIRKQNAAKWLKRKAILENDKQQILQGNLTNPKQPGNSPAAVS
jgi:hypothetical protein